jgi:hypothetical protein
MSSAEAQARTRVDAVGDDPRGRLLLMRSLYDDPTDRARAHLPFRRAATEFMKWQIHRGLLNPPTDPLPGSPWWRAVNERLLLDTCEARAIGAGVPGDPSTVGARAGLDFVARRTPRNWYRAHNVSIVSGYLEHHELAVAEGRVERFFINLVLLRVLYAHALVAAPRLALGWLAPVAPVLGDPRLGMTGIFLSLSRVLPDRYPLGEDVLRVTKLEHGFGHLIDIGVIQPRVRDLYDWSAEELGIPELAGLMDGDVPVYAWDPADDEPWHPDPKRWARWARHAVPAQRKPG